MPPTKNESPRTSSMPPPGALVAELLDVFFVRARQQIEECVEAAVERAPQLRDRAVERVERKAGGGSAGEFQRRFLDAFERAFRDQPNAVDQRVAHAWIIQAGGGRAGLAGQAGLAGGEGLAGPAGPGGGEETARGEVP